MILLRNELEKDYPVIGKQKIAIFLLLVTDKLAFSDVDENLAMDLLEIEVVLLLLDLQASDVFLLLMMNYFSA